MQTWSEKYNKILTNSGIDVLLLSGYVDDGRQLTSTFRPGMRYSKNKEIFEYSEAADLEDKNKKRQGESDEQRMARICLDAMNNINEDLEFTVETAAEFENEHLPTLDFQIWQEKDQTINHSYFQKPMKSPLVIMARSGMGTQQKIQILANELTRRLSNVNTRISENTKEKTRIIEQYTKELKNSEYPARTAKEIIKSGIRGYKTRLTRRTASGQEFYRAAHRTINTRVKKKLLSRENWYKQEQEN